MVANQIEGFKDNANKTTFALFVKNKSCLLNEGGLSLKVIDKESDYIFRNRNKEE